MLLTQRHLLPVSAGNLLVPSLSPLQFPNSSNFQFRPTNLNTRCSAHKSWIAQLSEQLITTGIADVPTPEEEGPVELPSIPPIFATDDDPTPLQTATSVLLSGAIAVFLFRSLRRRAKRAKETRFRSSGETKSITEEALESLKSVTLSPGAAKSPPSPIQTFLGAITAGVISLIFYKFTTTIEASLNRQTMPDSYSVRQITITIRTIINGFGYLATFVFGFNALGLLLYSLQLGFNSLMDDSNSESESPSGSSTPESGDIDPSVISTPIEDQNSDNSQ